MNVVLIGAGLAAQRCAETLRNLGHDGPIAMYGDEPHAPYDRPPLSKAFLNGERPDTRLRPPTWYRDHDVDLRHERVTSLDSLQYDRALIATGAKPITLAAFPHAHTLRTREDAIALDEAMHDARHIAIIGAGLIGQEVASAAVARGLRATLIDAQPNPFDALMGPGGGHHLRKLHEENGVELRLGQRLSGPLQADLVLVAIGVKPAWELPKRLPEHVFAAGDVTGTGHWEAAVVQGAQAARAMLGLAARPEGPPLVWSDQHGVRIQRLGDLTNVQPNGDLTYSKNGRLKAVVLMNQPEAVRKVRRDLQEAA